MVDPVDSLVERGWALVTGAVAAGVVEGIRAAWQEEAASYEGPLLRVLTSRPEPHTRNGDGWVTNPVINLRSLSADRFPSLRRTEERLLAAAPFAGWARGAFGEAPALLQSGYWESAVGTPDHRDTHPLDPTEPMLGALVALEPMRAGVGRFWLLDRSHRLDDQDPTVAAWLAAAHDLYRRQYLDRDLPGPNDVLAVQARLGEVLRRHPMDRLVLELAPGDVVLWDSRTVHGSEPPTPGGGRRSSVILHFVPLASVEPALTASASN
jgi:phytanoyl-CoA hydroxylase